jgi:hypothetical protein
MAVAIEIKTTQPKLEAGRGVIRNIIMISTEVDSDLFVGGLCQNAQDAVEDFVLNSAYDSVTLHLHKLFRMQESSYSIGLST